MDESNPIDDLNQTQTGDLKLSGRESQDFTDWWGNMATPGISVLINKKRVVVA